MNTNEHELPQEISIYDQMGRRGGHCPAADRLAGEWLVLGRICVNANSRVGLGLRTIDHYLGRTLVSEANTLVLDTAAFKPCRGFVYETAVSLVVFF